MCRFGLSKSAWLGQNPTTPVQEASCTPMTPYLGLGVGTPEKKKGGGVPVQEMTMKGNRNTPFVILCHKVSLFQAK